MRARTRWRVGAVVVEGLTVVAFTVLVGGGCSARARRISAPDARGCVPLEVENHNWGDVVVTLMHDGSSSRLGLVTAASRATLRVPAGLTGASHVLQLYAHAVGNPSTHTSERFTTSIGEVVEWDLETDLARSSLAIRQLPPEEADSLMSAWCRHSPGGP